MQRVRVKIEGLMGPRDAVRVAQMGADAIGMVFAKSPRRIDAATAASIAQALPPWVATVGVFVNDDAETINAVVEAGGIDYVQLHGEEPPGILPHVGAKCIKAFRVRGDDWLDEVRRWLDGVADRGDLAAVLLDAYDAKAHGGTGKQFNWDLVAEARAAGRLDDVEPIILAGGLSPDCVAEAIRVVQPWAVDVASGVEQAPGVKDFDQIARFLRAVGQAGPMTGGFWT